MKKEAVFFYLLLFLIFGCVHKNREIERRVLINDGWKFYLGEQNQAMFPDYNDEAWCDINLPHDWAIEGEFSAKNSSGTGYLPGGIGWYRKTLWLPRKMSEKTVYLMFDGAYQNSEVWVNGAYIGIRPYGYISFYYDITDHIKPGENNVIAVRLDHTKVKDSRWYTGNGIYRNVWLITPGKIHIKPWGTYIRTTQDSCRNLAVANIEIELQNGNGNNVNLFLVNKVFDRDGNEVGQSSKELVIQSKTETKVKDKLEIPNPNLWYPESPSMYKLVTTIKMNGKELDSYTTNFGIRAFRFDPNKGFFCNGKSYKLKGICLHHDFGPLGAARHPNSAYMVLKKLKEVGANAIRTSHNPEDPYFLTMLDTMGFFVQVEAFDEWRHGKKKWIQGRNVGRDEGKKGLGTYYETAGYSDFFNDWAEKDIKDMVRRDRNHPSIVMWSIGNEIDYPNDPYADQSDLFWESGNPEPKDLKKISSMLTGWVKECDTTRFVTAALANIPVANNVGYAGVLDIVGYNYQEKFYEEDHQNYPERVIYGSENGDSFEAWKAVRDNDYVAGQFLWTGIDYHGEAGRFPSHSAGAGIMDMCGFEKAIYYQRKSFWTEAPMVKIFVQKTRESGSKDIGQPLMHWNFETGQEVVVGFYTNCDAVELILNGENFGKKVIDGDNRQELFWRLTL